METLVGQFPGLGLSNRRTIRQELNPLDKSTVVSIYPKEINETKPTIQPGTFHINKGSYDNPALLVVGSSSWWREIDENQPLLEIPQGSIIVAGSIVNDYVNGLAMINETMGPGLFFIPGDIDLIKLRVSYKDRLDAALIKQRNWFMQLIKIADGLWARTGGNPIVIDDDMRMAANELNLTDKEWLKDSQTVGLIRCVACGGMRNPLYPICSNCKMVIDVAAFNKLGIRPLEEKK